MENQNVKFRKEEVFSVKIFFINPIELLNVVINTLLTLEYETYYVEENNRNKLLKILSKNKRNIIFFCIRNKLELEKWIEYILDIKKLKNTSVQTGCFYYDYMGKKDIELFLKDGIAMIPFAEIKNDTLLVMKKILTYFEAKGTRQYIRTKTYGISKIYFYFKNISNPIVGEVKDISSHAFSCEIPGNIKEIFSPGSVFHDTLMILRGIRLKVSVKALGFSTSNKNLFIFKFITPEMRNDKMVNIERIPQNLKQKIYTYIKECLKEDISGTLNMITEEKTNSDSSEKKQSKKKNANEKKENQDNNDRDIEEMIDNENSEVENEDKTKNDDNSELEHSELLDTDEFH